MCNLFQDNDWLFVILILIVVWFLACNNDCDCGCNNNCGCR